MTGGMTGRRRLGAALAAATGLAALTGCAATLGGVAAGGGFGGLDAVTKVRIDPSYSRGQVSADTADGAKVEVIGAGVDPQAVADALRLPSYFTPRPFTALPSGPATTEIDRLVLVFGASAALDGDDACQGLAPPPSTGLVVLAAYCDDDEPLSEGRLSSPALSDPASPEAAQAYRGLLAKILPAQNPERDRDPLLWLWPQ